MSDFMNNGVESMFFDRDEPHFKRYITEELGLSSQASDDDIVPLMEIDLKGRELPGVVLPETDQFTY